MTKIANSILITLLLAGSACCTGNKTSESKNNAKVDVSELQGDWRLDSYQIDGKPTTFGAFYKLSFNEPDNTFSLSTDCNTISGEFQITNDTIRFKNIFVTEMACDNMTVEQDLLRLFNAPDAYAIYSDEYTAYTIYFYAPSVGNATFSQLENDRNFIGEYTDQNDGSTLTIAKNTNAGPSIKINLLRLTEIDDGIGKIADDTLAFAATDAAGNPINGKITLDGDTAILVFTESTWRYLPNGTTYRFTRDSQAMIKARTAFVGKTYSGGGNGGGLGIDLTIRFKADSICECTSNFYQAFPKPITVEGMYFVNNGIVEVTCRPEGFEDNPVDWHFSIKGNGNELSFNSSDTSEEGSMGKDWITLKKK